VATPFLTISFAAFSSLSIPQISLSSLTLSLGTHYVTLFAIDRDGEYGMVWVSFKIVSGEEVARWGSAIWGQSKWNQ